MRLMLAIRCVGWVLLGAGLLTNLPAMAQATDEEQQAQSSIGVPMHLATHPLASLHVRVHHSFETLPVQQSRLRFNYSLGNVWLPGVTVYQPHNQADINELEAIEWQLRQYSFNPSTQPADSIYFSADGVLRNFQLAYETGLGKRVNGHQRWSLSTSANLLLLDRGRAPASLLTSDDFIEWFHSNVRGPEDPFARRAMSMNNAGITYRDARGYLLEMQTGDLWLTTVQGDLRYHFGRATQATRWFGSLGFHPGLRMGYGQLGADAGLSATLMRSFPLGANGQRNGKRILLGAAGDVVRHNLLNRSENVELTTRPSLMSAEVNLSLEGKKRPNYQLAGGLNYRCHQPLQATSNMAGQVLSAPFTSYHWHHAGAHLFHNGHGWTLWMAYQRKRTRTSVYVREDFPIDNAPDLQTGIEFAIQL